MLTRLLIGCSLAFGAELSKASDLDLVAGYGQAEAKVQTTDSSSQFSGPTAMVGWTFVIPGEQGRFTGLGPYVSAHRLANEHDSGDGNVSESLTDVGAGLHCVLGKTGLRSHIVMDAGYHTAVIERQGDTDMTQLYTGYGLDLGYLVVVPFSGLKPALAFDVFSRGFSGGKMKDNSSQELYDFNLVGIKFGLGFRL